MASLTQIQRARRAAKAAGVKMRRGPRETLHFTWTQKIIVWYPMSGRGANAEEADLEFVIQKIEKGL